VNVELISHTPQPEKVCAAAAKLCYSKGMPKIDQLTPDKAGPFLNKILSLGHLSILEHASFTFAIEGISRACSHQLVRHRIASFSQQSQRYVSNGETLEHIVPPSIQQDMDLWEEYQQHMDASAKLYQILLGANIPTEDARFVLPNAAETKLVMTMNARELLHFFSLRCCERAQWEISALANEMQRLVKLKASALFQTAGPGCVSGDCPEGPMSCKGDA